MAIDLALTVSWEIVHEEIDLATLATRMLVFYRFANHGEVFRETFAILEEAN